MQVRFDSLNRFETPLLYLCNPGSTCVDGLLSNIVGCLSDTSDEELILNFNTTSELNLRVNLVHREDAEEDEYVVRMYRSLQNRRLIFVDTIGYFVITEITDGYSEGKHYKDIRASSCEIEIQNKMLPYIADGTYRFDDLIKTIVETLPLWTIGHIDPSISPRYRSFEDISEDTNSLAFMQTDMQDAYECIILFDIVNRRINVYDQYNYVHQTKIHLTKNDLITSINISENSDDLYTALYVQGDENLNISPVNPLGGNVIYNFTYYLNWMNKGLRDRVVSWQELVESYRAPYRSANLEYYNYMTEKSMLQSDIDKLNIQITMYQRCRDNIVATNETGSVDAYNTVIESNGGNAIDISEEISETLSSIDSLISNAKYNLSQVNDELAQIDSALSDCQDRISSIRSRVSMTDYFTEQEYSELYHYIFEGSYNDEHITVTDIMTYAEKFEQMGILYDRSVAQLDRVSSPTQEFSVDVENFIFSKEFEPFSQELETGCLINVELDADDIAALFLTNITVNYDDQTLSLTFGNRYNRFDPKAMFEDVLGDVKKSSNSIDYIKDIIYPVKNGQLNELQEAMATSRVLTMNAALCSTNEDVIIDDTGYTGRKLLEPGVYDPRQVKLTSNSMVFTDDAWQSSKVAIGELIFQDGSKAYGINSNVLYGDIVIGNQLHILDNSGNDLMTVVDGKIEASVTGMVPQEGGESESFGWSLLSNEFSIAASGDPVFRASKDGIEVSGCINATSGIIGGCAIDEVNGLQIKRANIAEELIAEKIIVNNSSGDRLLFAGDNTVQIAGWQADSNSLYYGHSFNNADCFICTGSKAELQIGGSDPISGWMLKAGDNFGVTNHGDMYCSSANLTGTFTSYGPIEQGRTWHTTLDNGALDFYFLGERVSSLEMVADGVPIPDGGIEYFKGIQVRCYDNTNSEIRFGCEYRVPIGDSYYDERRHTAYQISYRSEDPSIAQATHGFNGDAYFGDSVYIDGLGRVRNVFAVESDDFSHDNQSGMQVEIRPGAIHYYDYDHITASMVPIQFGVENLEPYHRLNGTWDIMSLASTPPVTSDSNKKNSISNQHEVYSRIFDKLTPVTYKYNNGTSGRTHLGLIAQDVEDAVLSEGITTKEFAAVCYDLDESGQKVNYGIRYDELVSMSIYEIQKLKQRIAELEAKFEQ